MRTRGSQNRDTRDHRRALLDAALAELVERGLEGATLESICARVGVSRGSAYHHFASKERIAVALCAETIEAIHAEVRLGVADTKNAREYVESLVRSYLGWFEPRPQHGALVFSVVDGGKRDTASEELRAMQADLEGACAAWLAPLVASGEVRRLPRALAAPLLLGPSRDFLRGWFVHPTPRAMREAKRDLPAAAWRAIATRPPRD